eukprot:GFUD01007061.1.p1 GENE.GFUD01007061.1~~GFUD01007061.1.p1  ORF type:complete len:148 (+),score=26.51 GFUD01007061.1:113-556(+)
MMMTMTYDRAQDRLVKQVTCSHGRRGRQTNIDMTLNAGQAAMFTATNGVRACAVKFKPGPTCPKIRLTCQPAKKFYINCSEGDRMVVRTSGKEKRLCYHERPQFSGSPVLPGTKPIFSTSDIKILLVSPSRNSKARCRVGCVYDFFN